MSGNDKRRQPQRRHTADTQKPTAVSKGLSSTPSTSAGSSRFLETDVVVMVLGRTGSGRSTFINALLKGKTSRRMEVGGRLETCTTEVSHEILDGDKIGRGHRLVLVDTPGFDATYGSDSGVLQKLADWSRHWLPQNGCRGGIIFLHDINVNPNDITHPDDLATVTRAFTVAIAITKWHGQPLEGRSSRHDQLCEKLKVASAHQFDQGTEEAWNIVNSLLRQIPVENPVDFLGKLKAMTGVRVEAERAHEGRREEARKGIRQRIADAFRRIFGSKS